LKTKYIAINAAALAKPDKTGVEWYVWQMLKYLAREWKTTDPTIVLFAPKSYKLPQFKNKNWRTKYLPGKCCWTQYHMLKFLKRYPPALLFSPSYVAPRFLPKNIKTVNVVHGLEGEQFPEFRSIKDTLADYLISIPVLKKSSEIIAVSEHTKQDLNFFNSIPLSKIKVALSGRGSLKDNFEPKIKKDSKKINFLFLGGDDERKNLPLALRIFSCLQKLTSKNIILTLAGKITDAKIQQLVKTNKNIAYLDYVEEKRKVALLESSHFLLYPSFYEGFGFPVLEAQACGTVPIVLAGSGLDEVSGADIVEFNPLKEKESLAKITALIKDQKKYSQMQKKGLKNSQQFTWQKCAQGVRKILIKNHVSRVKRNN
jgi:glycosyltransferase involved in cell wall biosynthesis